MGTNAAILNVVESVIGGEILCHPQFNMRGMLPEAKGVNWCGGPSDGQGVSLLFCLGADAVAV